MTEDSKIFHSKTLTFSGHQTDRQKRNPRRGCETKIQTTFHQYQKLYSTPPMTWCTYLQSFEKIQQCVFERKLNVTDGQTDRRTGGVAISPVPGLRRRGR